MDWCPFGSFLQLPPFPRGCQSAPHLCVLSALIDWLIIRYQPQRIPPHQQHSNHRHHHDDDDGSWVLAWEHYNHHRQSQGHNQLHDDEDDLKEEQHVSRRHRHHDEDEDEDEDRHHDRGDADPDPEKKDEPVPPTPKDERVMIAGG